MTDPALAGPLSAKLTPYDTARDYVSKGWVAPLPLPAGQKGEPPLGFTGWRNSRWVTDDDVTAWIEKVQGTGANIGNRVPPGVAGIDYDAYRDPAKVRPGHGYADRVSAWGDLPPTWASTSRDDGSMIRWYRVPEGTKLPGDAGDDVEIIHSDYRYAVAPPSMHPDGRPYRWLTPVGEVTDEIPDVAELPELPKAWVEGLAGLASVRVTDEAVEEFLAELPDGDYDDDTQRLLDEFSNRLNAEDGWGRFADCIDSQKAMLRITGDLAIAGACGVAGMPVALAAAEDLFVTYRVSSGDSARDAAGAWRRGLSGAIGYVRESGITAIEPFDVPADLLGRRSTTSPSSDPFGERLISRRGLAKLPDPEPLIADTIDRRTVALIAGYHGTCKSFVALAWGASVATGTPWMGRPVQRGRVLYIVGEGAHGIDGRLSAWEEAHGAEIPDDGFITYPAAAQLADPGVLDAILRHLAGHHYDLVIVDTVARSAVGLDENSAKDMGLLIDAAEQIKRATESGTVLLVHHTGKDKATVRGSSALEAAMDTVYATEGDPLNVRLRRTKRKDGPMEDQHHLRLREVGRSAVLESLDIEIQRKVTDSDLEVRAWVSLGTVFGDRVFTKTEAVTVLTDEDHAGLSRASAYRVITRLGTADVLHSVDGPSAKTVRFVLNRDAARKIGLPDARPFRPETPPGTFVLPES